MAINLIDRFGILEDMINNVIRLNNLKAIMKIITKA